MGMMKARAMAEQDAYYSALDFLCHLGVLKQCDNHPGTYYEGNGDIENAYKVANGHITAGAIKLQQGVNRRVFTDRLKAAYDTNAALDFCQECAEHIEQ